MTKNFTRLLIIFVVNLFYCAVAFADVRLPAILWESYGVATKYKNHALGLGRVGRSR